MKTLRTRPLMLANWKIPLIYTSVTLLVGLFFPRFEHHFMPRMISSMSPAAAMAICSAIASRMIALTGIVFSLTFLMVQFSATAYSPRLVMWVAREPVVSHALGVFIATFLYAVSMLAWVDRSTSGKVPFISAWMVLGLLVVSMGMFVALVERIGMLQVNRMLVFTGNRGRAAITEVYSSERWAMAADQAADYRKLGVTQTIRHSGRPRIIQAVRTADLVELARQSDSVVEFIAAVGDTVLEMTPLLRVYGAREPLDEAALKDAIEVGSERTFEQDPQYALRLLVDIGIKALSPAINDPTTAVQALDQIEDLLIRLGQHNLEIGSFRDHEGTLRVILPHPTWENFLRLALDEIHSYGAGSVQVMRRMKALIKNLLSVLSPERHAALRHWEQELQESIARSFVDMDEQIAASIPDRQGLGLGHEESKGS